MTITTAAGCTPKSILRALIKTAMNDIRAKGEEPSWKTVSKFVKNSGILRGGDLVHNPSAEIAGTGFEYVWQTSLSFVASDMKHDGELYRESGAPWVLTEWGITTAQLTHEIHKRKVVAKTCTICWLQHRPEIECY